MQEMDNKWLQNKRIQTVVKWKKDVCLWILFDAENSELENEGGLCLWRLVWEARA